MSKQRAYMSFGGGVQSTAIAMLAINRDERLLRATDGVLPELYIFADTGDEPKALYPHIEDMKQRIEATGAHFETVRTPLGKLGDHVKRAAQNGYARAEQLPFFVPSKTWEYAPIDRRCTSHFKIKPITAFARAWFGIYRGKTPDGSNVQVWLGISCDERSREKTGRVPKQKWSEYANPLIAMRWHRADCENYLKELGIEARRSACVYCPFHSPKEWEAIKADPDDYERALEIDAALEEAGPGCFGFDSPLYLTESGQRLRDYNAEAVMEARRRQGRLFDNWDNECSGVCGV